MCKFCEPILGNRTRCKNELTCPLRQSAYCAQCARYGHFLKDCVKNVEEEEPVEAPSPKPHEDIFEMRDDPRCFHAFLFKHKLSTLRMKEGMTEEEKRKVEEKHKKEVVKYLNDQEIPVKWIPTDWTKVKSKNRKADAQKL
jgi:hypothetical protein